MMFKEPVLRSSGVWTSLIASYWAILYALELPSDLRNPFLFGFPFVMSQLFGHKYVTDLAYMGSGPIMVASGFAVLVMFWLRKKGGKEFEEALERPREHMGKSVALYGSVLVVWFALIYVLRSYLFTEGSGNVTNV